MLPSDLAPLFAFDDLDATGSRIALRLRIGPRAKHRDLSFAELRLLVHAQAAMFRQIGARPGDRVAILLPHDERLVTNFLAAIWVGLVPSIIAWPTAKMEPQKYKRNLHAVLRSLNADWLATDPQAAGGIGANVDRTRVIDGTRNGVASDAPAAEIRRDGPAFIQFSGGTTGVQKSVPVSFAHFARQLASLVSALQLTREDGVVSWLPLYHDMGLIACFMMPFTLRIPVTMFSPMEWVMDPRPYLRAMGETQSTLTWLPNFAFSFLAKRARFAPGEIDLSSMRAFVNCSEPVRAESFDAFKAAYSPHGLRSGALHVSYAMAEATFAVTQTTDASPPHRISVARGEYASGRLREEDGGRPLVSCGQPVRDVEIRVVDSGGAPCAPGQIGEIHLRGGFIMDDYLDAAESERGARWAFSGDWYRTGDLGAMVNGHLYVTGRHKDVIIVGGVNVYPEDIEAEVGELPGIHAGRVVALSIDGAEVGTERLIVVAEVDTDLDLGRAAAIEEDVRKTVLAVAGTAAEQVFIVPPKWIVKSTAGKISRPETRTKLVANWDALKEERGDGE